MENTNSTDFNKISFTAKFVAYWRQFTDIPFAKEVAELIHANELIEDLLKKNQIDPKEIGWYGLLFELRYKSIHNLLRNTGAKQILELASGLSFRGLDLCRDKSVICVDTDLVELNLEKEKMVDQLRQKDSLEDYGNFHIASANAMDENQVLDCLKYFDHQKPVTIVNEGLLLYLTRAEMETIMGNIKTALSKFGGAWITPDFSIVENKAQVLDQRARVRNIISELTGRPLHANLFESEKELAEFLHQHGFKAEVFNQKQLVDDVVSIKTLNLDPAILNNALPHSKLWLITLLEG